MIRIGEKMESFSINPLGLLSDCHRRIERFLNGLITVAAQAQADDPLLIRSVPPNQKAAAIIK
ncbi:MAG TPA: hypothetical protein VFA47_09885 [Candidatus Manganitrophaceae bacterium]|nr:hypothetical protein [Candidatus Manganitrophaceae bacterium]